MNMKYFEFITAFDHLWRSYRHSYDQTRMLASWIISPWSKNGVKPQDFAQFDWDNKTTEEEKQIQKTSEQDVKRLETLAKKFEQQL